MLGQLFYFYSLAALYLQHTQHLGTKLGTKTTPDTQFAGVGERTREGKIISRTDLSSFHRKNILHKSTQSTPIP